MAGIGPHRKRLAPAVRERLELADEGQRRTLVRRENPELEHFVRANPHAIRFPFATVSVDDRRKYPGCLALGWRVAHSNVW